MTIELGALSETVTVTGEAPLIQAQSGERSSTVTTEAVQNLPICEPQLRRPRVADARRHRHDAHRLTRLDDELSDRRRLHNRHRRRRPGASVERRGDRRGSRHRVRLPGRVRPQHRSADHRRDQERHEPVPRIDLRHPAELRLELEQLGERAPTAIRKRSRSSRTGATRIGGPIGKPGGDNRWFFFYGHEYRPRKTGGAINRFRVPTLLERQGDFSQTTDNNGALFNTIRDASTGLPCSATDTRGVLQRRRRPRPHSAEPAVSSSA